MPAVCGPVTSSSQAIGSLLMLPAEVIRPACHLTGCQEISAGVPWVGAVSSASPALLSNAPGIHFNASELRVASCHVPAPSAGSSTRRASCLSIASQALLFGPCALPPSAAACSAKRRCPASSRPCAVKLAWLKLPLTLTSTARNLSSVGVADIKIATGMISSAGKLILAFTNAALLVTCQPPCHDAVNSPLPAAVAARRGAGMPGSCRSQRNARAASGMRRASSPLPVVLRSSPLTLATSPGAVSVTFALPPRAAGSATSVPSSCASRVFIFSLVKASVPPARNASQEPSTCPPSGSAANCVFSIRGLMFSITT